MCKIDDFELGKLANRGDARIKNWRTRFLPVKAKISYPLKCHTKSCSEEWMYEALVFIKRSGLNRVSFRMV